jgi:hypothetical protein
LGRIGDRFLMLGTYTDHRRRRTASWPT